LSAFSQFDPLGISHDIAAVRGNEINAIGIKIKIKDFTDLRPNNNIPIIVGMPKTKYPHPVMYKNTENFISGDLVVISSVNYSIETKKFYNSFRPVQ
jgi:hypothetical protein